MKGSREKASRRRTGGGGTTTWRRTGLERCLPGTRCRGGQPADGSEGKSPDPTRERAGTGLNGSGKCRTCPRWWWSKDEAALEARTGVHGAGRGAAKEQEADEVPYGRLRRSIGDERVTALRSLSVAAERRRGRAEGAYRRGSRRNSPSGARGGFPLLGSCALGRAGGGSSAAPGWFDFGGDWPALKIRREGTGCLDRGRIPRNMREWVAAQEGIGLG